MTIIEWAAIGALFLGIMVFCARIMRRGIRTLDENRRECLEHIRLEEMKIAEDRKNISSREHVGIMRAALVDLVRLEGSPTGWNVEGQGNSLHFTTPAGTWQIELLMRESSLKTSNRILHGRGKWHLHGFGHDEFHQDPANLMRSLNEHLHSSRDIPPEPAHLARRLEHLRQEPARGA